MSDISKIMKLLTLPPLLALMVAGCDNGEDAQKHQRGVWEGPCHDESWLLATTSGSPSSAKCPNKNHRMRVQVASMASQEEAAALVFCECQRPDPIPAASK